MTPAAFHSITKPCGSSEQMILTLLEKVFRIEGTSIHLDVDSIMLIILTPFFQGLDASANSESECPSLDDVPIADILHPFKPLLQDWIITSRTLVKATDLLAAASLRLHGYELLTTSCIDFSSQLLSVTMNLECIKLEGLSPTQVLSSAEVRSALKKIYESSKSLRHDLLKMQFAATSMQIMSTMEVINAAANAEEIASLLDELFNSIPSVPSSEAELRSKLQELYVIIIQLRQAMEDLSSGFTTVAKRAIPFLDRRMGHYLWTLTAVTGASVFFLTEARGLFAESITLDQLAKREVKALELVQNCFAAISLACSFVALISSYVTTYLLYRPYSVLPRSTQEGEYVPPVYQMIKLPPIFLIISTVSFLISVMVPMWSTFEFVLFTALLVVSMVFVLWQSWRWYKFSKSMLQCRICRNIMEGTDASRDNIV
ncbi:hypothetical protein FRC02_006113 [Tulasnella sp. 418]|nr:hypothetical protein FRC02_006113 [Tulasnella sp. 418]